MSERWKRFIKGLGTILLQTLLILIAIFAGLYLFAGWLFWGR